MKKRFMIFGRMMYHMSGCLICCLFWGMLCSLSVQADVIWTPEDSFFQRHESECTYVNRQYIAEGPDGVVILYKSPELPIEVARWENGFKAGISFTYQDSKGIVWGIYDYGGTCGWMPMDYMNVVYDTISFEEEYKDRIDKEEGALDQKYLGKEVYIWAYPGSETENTITLEEKYGYMPEYSRVFVDENGNRWGRIGYYLGYRSFWICLDQPEAGFAQLYPGGAPRRGNAQADSERREWDSGSREKTEEAERIVPELNNGMVKAAIYMVTLVVLVTGGMLITLRRGKRRQEN